VLVAFELPAVVAGTWFLFALQYTGRGEGLSPFAVAVVGLLIVLLVAPTVSFVVLPRFVDVPAGFMNALLGFTVVISEALALVGVFLVVATSLRQKAVPAAQTAMFVLAVGAVLVVPFAATTFQAPVATPAGVAAASLLFTATVRRYRVFERLPVATVVGRDRVVAEMAEGVVVTDTDGRVRDLNPAAERLLGVERDAGGDPLDAVAPSLPEPAGLVDAGPSEVALDGGRVASVTADAVTDPRGRTLGYLLVCRDVTAERRREDRLAVLTQLVAGATQHQMGVVADTAEEILDGDRRPDEGGERIRETATDVSTLVARVRDVERALADREPGQPTTADLDRVVADLRPDVDIHGLGVGDPHDTDTLGADDWSVAADPRLLTATFETLAAGAGSTAGSPELRVGTDEDAVEVAVSPLDPHDSGSVGALAVEIARLAAERAEWRVCAGDDTDARDAVTVRLPRAGSNADSRNAPGAQANATSDRNAGGEGA
jgi:PAS domain-containing protein